MNATRDGNRKGSSCGGVLGQLSHEVMVQHGSYFKLVSNNCHYLTSVLSDQILLESQTSEVEEGFTCATTRHNSKQSNVHHTSSPELPFSLVFYYPIEIQSNPSGIVNEGPANSKEFRLVFLANGGRRRNA